MQISRKRHLPLPLSLHWMQHCVTREVSAQLHVRVFLPPVDPCHGSVWHLNPEGSSEDNMGDVGPADSQWDAKFQAMAQNVSAR